MLLGAPRREWLAVVVPPVLGVALVLIGSGSTSGVEGWIAYSVAAVGGLTFAVVYTLYVARRGRLFLRDAAAIEKNRAAIARARSLGTLLAAGGLVAVGLATGSVAAVLFGVSGGALLGFWPGLVANFLRLRREKWVRMTSGDKNL